MLTLEQFELNFVNRLNLHFRPKTTADRPEYAAYAKDYFNAVKAYSPQVLDKAVEEIIQTNKNGFWPTVAGVRTKVQEAADLMAASSPNRAPKPKADVDGSNFAEMVMKSPKGRKCLENLVGRELYLESKNRQAEVTDFFIDRMIEKRARKRQLFARGLDMNGEPWGKDKVQNNLYSIWVTMEEQEVKTYEKYREFHGLPDVEELEQYKLMKAEGQG
ncbi:hypothetical protein [Kiloniella litopenaei]|uniref:hypothetical protein n=1 Tax=Kiloniella litopenaei TaxID=1549748 RepID=UPI003BA8920A